MVRDIQIVCHLICLVFESSTTELNVLSCHPCSQKSVPVHEEGLGKVGLDANNLQTKRRVNTRTRLSFSGRTW